ncbi:hypothetical protein [Aquimarina megaterium]|uniref:hypothetical protein n=1 Tax=Aquimarina megaterium TaxID=1443666 RepID=UPI0004B3DD2E|nr:hypothetical protein [Aquimarina megaterium]
MKKIALLCLAVVFVIGIQSCSKDELPLEKQEDVIIDKLTTGGPEIEFCSNKIYVRYGVSRSNNYKREFASIGRKHWFRYVLVAETDCPSIDIWYIPCDQAPSPPKNENEAVLDAESSATIGEGGAPPPPDISENPVYDNNDTTNYNNLCNLDLILPRSINTNPKTPNK